MATQPNLKTDQERMDEFAQAMNWRVERDSDGCVTFEGYLTLWPPETRCYESQTGYLAGYVNCTPGCWYQRNGDPGYPAEYDEAELGEFPKLERALAELANHWLEEQRANEAEMEMYSRGDPFAEEAA